MDHQLASTILTTRPNALMEPIHDRMPGNLRWQHENLWLDADPVDAALVEVCLAPYPAEQMLPSRVSTLVKRMSSGRSKSPQRAVTKP